MLLFIDKIIKGIAKAVEEMERQQVEQTERQLAARKAARDRRTAARQSVAQGTGAQSVAPIQLGEQHSSKPPVAAHHVHSRIENYGDENVFDEFVSEHHDPLTSFDDSTSLATQQKSSVHSGRTLKNPLAPHALKILSQPNGPRDAILLTEIFNRPEHRWE